MKNCFVYLVIVLLLASMLSGCGNGRVDDRDGLITAAPSMAPTVKPTIVPETSPSMSSTPGENGTTPDGGATDGGTAQGGTAESGTAEGGTTGGMAGDTASASPSAG